MRYVVGWISQGITDFLDFMEDSTPLALIFFVFLFIALVIGIMYTFFEPNKAHDEFMAQCMADGKKEYECTYMWRSSRQSTIPVFIPMPIPTGR